MSSYRYPLTAPHGYLTNLLLHLFRALGVLQPIPIAAPMLRRHRMMLAVDERRHYRPRNTRGSDLVPPAAAAISNPTQFGAFCSAVAASDGDNVFRTVPVAKTACRAR